MHLVLIPSALFLKLVKNQSVNQRLAIIIYNYFAEIVLVRDGSVLAIKTRRVIPLSIH